MEALRATLRQPRLGSHEAGKASFDAVHQNRQAVTKATLDATGMKFAKGKENTLLKHRSTHQKEFRDSL